MYNPMEQTEIGHESSKLYTSKYCQYSQRRRETNGATGIFPHYSVVAFKCGGATRDFFLVTLNGSFNLVGYSLICHFLDYGYRQKTGNHSKRIFVVIRWKMCLM